MTTLVFCADFKLKHSMANLKTFAEKKVRLKVLRSPFVVSLSNHEQRSKPPFDKLRANGGIDLTNTFKRTPEKNCICFLNTQLKAVKKLHRMA